MRGNGMQKKNVQNKTLKQIKPTLNVKKILNVDC